MRYMHVIFYFLGYMFHKSVSPSAALAREQPIVTVFSIDAGSSKDGFTSCSLASGGTLVRKRGKT